MWLAGPWAADVTALQEFALLEPDPEFPPQASAEAAEVMRPLVGAATQLAAVRLLKLLGVWAPHLQLAPVRAGLTEDFSSAVLVRVLSLSMACVRLARLAWGEQISRGWRG